MQLGNAIVVGLAPANISKLPVLKATAHQIGGVLMFGHRPVAIL